MTPQELSKLIRYSLYDMAFGDIINASVNGSAKMAGFILGACFIDAMASFRYGVTRDSAGKGAGQRFKDFVKEYLPTYDSDSLYKDLRCGLVHSYAEGGTYIFTDANKAGKHFQKQLGGTRTLLNLEDFCTDLENAYFKLESGIVRDNSIFQKAKNRIDSMGLMIVAPMSTF